MSRVYNTTDSFVYKNIDLNSDRKLVFLSGLGLDIRQQREGFFRRFALTHGISYLALDYTRYANQFSAKEDFCLDKTLSKTLEVLQQSQEKLILCGLCYGGSVALDIGVAMPNRIAGMIMLAPLRETSEYPFFNRTEQFLKQREARLEERHFDAQKLQKLIIFRQMIQAVAKQTPENIRPTYQGPIHIFHGENDNLVPLENSYHIQRVLQNPNTYIHVVQKTGHNVISDFEWKAPIDILKNYLVRS